MWQYDTYLGYLLEVYQPVGHMPPIRSLTAVYLPPISTFNNNNINTTTQHNNTTQPKTKEHNSAF